VGRRDSRLVENARIAIADADNRVVVSAVSVWEIAIKRASGKLAFHHNILEVLTRTRFDSVDHHSAPRRPCRIVAASSCRSF